jgi:single-stranded-DNA-specific exonuclease
VTETRPKPAAATAAGKAAHAAARPAVPAIPGAAVAGLQRVLGVTHVTAQALVRRGFSDPDDARRWLSGRTDEIVPLPGIDAAVELVLEHVAAGHQILVHGDYDVDGVAATAILLDVLELLGAQPKWHLPRRGTDGYGVTATSLARIERLAPQLVITVDCGITAVEETAQMRAQGIDVLITDHHLPRGDGELPDTTILHPMVLDGQRVDPTGEPCGAGVAAELAIGLLERTGHAAAALRDGISELAALATIADCVPLTGANRSLVRDGLGALARTRRPGLRALLRSARVDATALDGTTVAFRLSPRLNAAGRMARADLALALVRASSDEEATRLAEELERCNLRRREVELEVRRSAEKQVRELGEREGYVLSGEGWPAGVIGIVASRIAEQTDRPTLVIGVEGASGVGSARSAQGVNLAGLLAECSEHLQKFGGHAAAAGCEVATSEIPALAAAFDAAAREALEQAGPAPGPTVDAVAEVRDLTLSLADELAAFEPTGEGNPSVRLLLPGVRVVEESPMGSGGEHRRAVIVSGGARTNAVAFSSPSLPVDVPVDLVVDLERSTYGGTVEARVLIRSVHPLERDVVAPAARVGIDAGALAALLAGYQDAVPAWQAPPQPSSDRRGASVAALLRVASACGRDVIAYAADPARRTTQLEALGWHGTVVGPAGLAGALELTESSDGLVICVDPPLDPRASAALRSGSIETWWSWSSAELTYGVHVLEREFALRPLMVALFRGLREAGRPLPALGLLPLLPQGDAAVALGRAVRVLDELGLVRVGDGLSSIELIAEAVSDPAGSPTFRSTGTIVEEARSWSLLNQPPS